MKPISCSGVLLLSGAVLVTAAGGGGVARIRLPAPESVDPPALDGVLRARRSVRDFTGESIPLEDLARLLWAAQGVTDERGYRTAPSAGALYPLELHVVADRVADLPAGTFRYVPGRHELIPEVLGSRTAELAAAARNQEWVEAAAAVIVIAGVYGRTTDKYHSRGRRYVHFEVGHAAQNLLLQAAALELGAVVVGAFDDDEVVRLLELPSEERPLALVVVGSPKAGAD